LFISTLNSIGHDSVEVREKTNTRSPVVAEATGRVAVTGGAIRTGGDENRVMIAIDLEANEVEEVF